MASGQFYPGAAPAHHQQFYPPSDSAPPPPGGTAYPPPTAGAAPSNPYAQIGAQQYPGANPNTYEQNYPPAAGGGVGGDGDGDRGKSGGLVKKMANMAINKVTGSSSASTPQPGQGGYPYGHQQPAPYGGGGGQYPYGQPQAPPRQQHAPQQAAPQAHHGHHGHHGGGGQPAGDGRRRKALLIGCNYPGTRAALSGCCNDAVCMEYLLRHKFRYKDIRILRDDGKGDRRHLPTRRNIMAHIDWLVGDARAGDSLFFHFSGHGSQKRDWTGDERDGLNETICPTDFQSAGQIVDDDLNERLVRRVPEGCILHSLLDACHSGTGMDLPFVAMIDPRSQRMYWTDERGKRYKGTSGGLAVQFGACKDEQTAADTSGLSADKTSTGAATFLFIQAVEHLSKRHEALTYEAVLRDMQAQIRAFNKQQGRGVDERPIGGYGGGGGGLIGGLIGMALNEVVGSGLLGPVQARARGQTPQLSASEQFNLSSRVCM